MYNKVHLQSEQPHFISLLLCQEETFSFAFIEAVRVHEIPKCSIQEERFLTSGKDFHFRAAEKIPLKNSCGSSLYLLSFVKVKSFFIDA